MEKIVNRLIDDAVQKVDTYTNNGSTWLIFTDDKRWVIELTKDGTLWYNYNFFNSLFAYASMDVIENQHYITKWVENNVINKKKPVQKEVKLTKLQCKPKQLKVEDAIQNGVKEAKPMDGWVNSEKIVGKTIQNGVIAAHHQQHSILDKVEYAIQNGVKQTFVTQDTQLFAVEYAIQNGVKQTLCTIHICPDKVEYAIQNGVKQTYSDKIPHEYDWTDQFDVKEVIETGVKHTEKSLQIDGSCVIEDVIKEGVKHTEYGDWEYGDERLDDIIKNGVKETLNETHHRRREVVQTVKNGIKETHDDVYHHNGRVEGVIKNGIKEVQPLPAQDGNRDWGKYYHGKEDITKPHTKYVDDVLEKGKKI